MLKATIVVLLAVFISQSDAYCNLLVPVDCVYNGRTITNGTASEFLDECVRCECDMGYLGCCSMGIAYTDYPSNCKVVPDGPCRDKVVMIDDEKEPCTGPIVSMSSGH